VEIKYICEAKHDSCHLITIAHFLNNMRSLLVCNCWKRNLFECL